MDDAATAPVEPMPPTAAPTDAEGPARAGTAAGELEGRLAAVIDTLARERRLLHAIVDDLPVGVLVVDADGAALMLNRALVDMWRGERPLDGPDAYRQYEAWDATTGAPVAPADWPVSRARATGERQPSRTLAFRRFDGTLGVMESGAAPIVDAHGRVVLAVAVAQDVTDARRTLDALREADRRKDEFLAMLSHELRNPLAPIVNALRVLERSESHGPAGARAVAMIGRQLAQMRRLVDDLLEVSRISRGLIGLRPEPMALEHAVRHAVDATAGAREGKRQSLDVAVPRGMRLVADPVRVAQVLENLLSNATKYTPPGGSIGVDAREDGGWVELRVSDDGIGLEPGQLEHVFEMFVQAEPGVGEHQGGLGIGLALSRRLAALHGGTLHAESGGRGRGATFVLRLPRDGAAGR